MDVLINACFLSLFVGHVLAYSQLFNNEAIAVSSSAYPSYVTSRAVDGNFDQNHNNCSHSAVRDDIKEAWLRIDLGGIYSVKSVKFWYRADRGSDLQNTIRLRGYSLRVSNETTVPTMQASCYIDPGNVTLPTIIEKECERTARYIWIYQSKKSGQRDVCPILEICEVQVFGCNLGHYGTSCSQTCDKCKNNATCNIEFGKCYDLDCSKNVYQPPLCTECISRKYGPYCEKPCSENCLHDVCHRRNGTCLQGCKNGYRGIFCEEQCQPGVYGMNCNKACGHCYNNTTCRHDDGTCLQGCAAGFKSYDCKTPCNDGEYGVNCHFNCSRHCIDGEVCNKKDGSCRSCADGYTGIKCNTSCEAGKYGKACSKSCGACLNSIDCDHITGSCELGCEPGWQKTAQCKTACINGTFGLNCQYNCSGNCLNEEPCNSTDGTCTSCSPGWDTSWCNKSITNLMRLVSFSIATIMNLKHLLCMSKDRCLLIQS